MRIGIDATNVGGGGGITHLVGILSAFDYNYFENKISKIIVFSSKKVLDMIPDSEIIDKVTFLELNGSLLNRISFQFRKYDRELDQRCDILLSITGDYIGKFSPVIGMSRNMLLYEREIWKEIKDFKEILRFWLIFRKQKKCFRNANGVIFISNYAQQEVSKQISLKDKKISIIHHGISPKFIQEKRNSMPILTYSIENPFVFLYVSPIHVYKHQWNVVAAISNLRKKGIPVKLVLAGSVSLKLAGKRLEESLKRHDPSHEFVDYIGHVQHDKLHEYYKQADGIIFASTCENMPNTLIESMASGRAIACSDKQPMPEFLGDNGFYFNSKDVSSIEKALEKLISNPEICDSMIEKNLDEVKKFSWKKTSFETFEFLLNNNQPI